MAIEVINHMDDADQPMIEWVRTYLPDGTWVEREVRLQRETSLEVVVDGSHAFEVPCSLGGIPDLVVGRLFMEGVIQAAEEIASIELTARPLRANVRLVGVVREFLKPKMRSLSSYTASEPWSLKRVMGLAELFARDTDSHRATHGTHSCIIEDRDGRVVTRCDVGRHNAFDKAVGAALMAGMDLAECVAFTSGRVPRDMAIKAVRAGIPVLVSKANATDKAIALAREAGLTLLTCVSPKSVDVLVDPWADWTQPYELACTDE